ncbi:MAG: SH3 domain-containing protein, partial [Bacteroidota bacterium]
FARADIDYWWAYQLLRFRVEHAVANGQAGPLELPAEYYDFLNRVSISNDDALLNQNYRYFLEQYLAFRRENRGRQMPSNFYNQTLLVEIPSLLVLERPDKPPVLAEVRRGDRLKYLEERSETSTKVLIGEELREGHWHKIRTVDGVEGWIIGVGIRFETVDSAYVQRPDAYDGAALHLRGAALEYVVASKLYWRSHVENNAVFLAELRDFIARTQLPGYRKRLEVALAELTPKPSPSAADSTQINYGASHYLIVREAKVLSRKEAPLGTLSEAVVEGFGPAEEVQLREGISTAGPGVASKGKSRKRRRKESKSQGRKSKRKSKRKATEEGVVEPAEAIAALPAPAPVANNSSLPTTQTHPPSPTEEAPAYVHIDPQARHGDRLTRPVAIDLRTPLAGKLELVLHEEPIAFTERPCPLQAQSPTQYRGELRYAGIKTGYIAYRGERFDLYLEGDAPLRLSFDPATFGRSLRFSGPGSAANNWMLTIARLRRTGAATREAKIREAGPEEFSQYLGEQRRVFHAELTRYGAEFSLSTTFLAFARADIDYWWATQLLNYPWEHPLQKGLPAPMQLPDDYYAFFDELEMSNDRALPNANYAYFLDAFMDYQVQLAANAHRSEWEIAREQLRGQARYFYEASLLVRACKRGRAQQEGGRIAEFVED